MSQLSDIIGQTKPLALPLVFFSFVTNLSVLATPLFMMLVIDRVLPSGNLNTLVMLLMLAAVAMIVTAVVEYFRDQALGRTSEWLEYELTQKVLSEPDNGSLAKPLRDVACLRDFTARQAATLLDIPWIPLFLFAAFLIHPAFLALMVFATLLFYLLARLDTALAEPAEKSSGAIRSAGMSSLANLEACGPSGQLMALGGNFRANYLQSLGLASARLEQGRHFSNGIGAITRFSRMFMQIGSLSVGAYLVTQGALSAGGMIGASIILGKTSGIIEGAIRLIGSRDTILDAFKDLSDRLSGGKVARTEVADLSGAINAVDLTIPRGGGQTPRIERISLKVAAGECIAIMGNSGSGKSTLLEALAGIVPAPIGNTFFDETDVRTLDEKTCNTLIGYVPQQAQIFDGTIAQNISRFALEPDDSKILAAARLAGIHGMVSALPGSYETDLGKVPHALSAGQRQRVAFARALYEPPKYLFMDEPNALLDHQAERQMADAIYRLKETGTTIVMTAHRVGIVNLADRIVVLEDGRIADIGPRADILGRAASAHRRIRLPISGGALQDLCDWVNRQFVRLGDEEFRTRAATIATELYSFARDNGPEAKDRHLNFEFKYLDSQTCTITLSEHRRIEIEAKVHKVRKMVEMSLPDLDGLGTDERSLATVMQLTNDFQHKSAEDYTALFASISPEMPANALLN